MLLSHGGAMMKFTLSVTLCPDYAKSCTPSAVSSQLNSTQRASMDVYLVTSV